jgi:hypothetical protein
MLTYDYDHDDYDDWGCDDDCDNYWYVFANEL